MTTLDELIVEIDDKYCLIDSESTRHPSKVTRVYGEGIPIIYFNAKAFQGNAERLVALAHESGHCETNAFYNVYTPYDNIGQHELRATKHSVYRIVPLDELIKECRWEPSTYDLAEHFGVTVEFMRTALEIYQDDLREAIARIED